MLNLLKFRTKSYLKKNKSSRLSLPYNQSDSIGIIFTIEDLKKHEMIKAFVRKLEGDGKKVEVMSFLPRDKQNYEFLFDFFTDKEISFWGHNTSDKAVRFSEASFDYLFYLDTEPNPLILNLLARSKARCRVGKYWEEGKPFFELMIESTGDTKILIDGMFKYTSQLR